MLVEVIKIVKFHVLSDLTEKICDLIVMDNYYTPNIANSTGTSKTLVEKCALDLSREIYEISQLETKLMGKLKLADDVRNYMNHVEEGLGLRCWPEIFQKGRISVFETHYYMEELYDAVGHFNKLLEPFGELVCKCITCYNFKQQQITKRRTSTMQIDDFENIQQNLRLARLCFGYLISVPHLRSIRELSIDSMKYMAEGFERSLFVYRSIWRGMRMFDKKINEARQEEKKVTNGSMRKLLKKY